MFNRLPTTLLCWKPLAMMDANYRRARVQSLGVVHCLIRLRGDETGDGDEHIYYAIEEELCPQCSGVGLVSYPDPSAILYRALDIKWRMGLGTRLG